MAIAKADIEQLAAMLDRGRDAWIHGRVQWEDEHEPIVQAEDAMIFGPFGGAPAPGGPAPQVRPDIQRAIAARFHGGSGATELVRSIIAGDLAVVVSIDRSMVQFDGYENEQPWNLRVTEVFRRDGDTWVRIHRHADPLVVYRDLDATIALQNASESLRRP